MTSSTVLALIAIAAASARVAGDDSVCGERGSATLSGTSDAPVLGPFVAAHSSVSSIAAYISLEEQLATYTCAPSYPPLMQTLVLAFCDPVITPGEYTIVTEQEFPQSYCPGERTAVVFIQRGPNQPVTEHVVSGKITVSAYDTCASGTFSATFADQSEIQGEFDAIICPPPDEPQEF